MSVVMLQSPYVEIRDRGSRAMKHRSQLIDNGSSALPQIDASLKAITGTRGRVVFPDGHESSQQKFREEFERDGYVLEQVLRLYEEALVSGDGELPSRFVQLTQTAIEPPVLVEGPTHGKGGFAFYGAVLDLKGRAIFIPYNSNNVGIYDPATGTFTDGAATGAPNDGFLGGCRVDDKIYFAPAMSTTVGIFDATNDTYASGAAHGKGAFAFYGAIPLPDDTIVMVPAGSNRVMLYDPVADSFTNGMLHGYGSGAYPYANSCLMPDGRIFLTPGLSTRVEIYDPQTDTIFIGPDHNAVPQGASAFWFGAAVSMPNGKVLMVPHRSNRFKVYDPETNTIEDGPLHGEASFPFFGAQLLPTGEVLCQPYLTAYLGLYDWRTNTYSRSFYLGTTPGVPQGWYGGCLTPEGKVICAPYGAANVYEYETFCNVPRSVVYDPLVNNGVIG